MNNNNTLYVGLDVHKESITVAYAINSEPVELMGRIGTAPTDIQRLCKRIVYEAGPCGYGLFRRLMKSGVDCMVCASSLIPKKPEERVKTDRRDAIKLVRSLCAGDLSAVYVSGVEDEAFRDLARACASARDESTSEIVSSGPWDPLCRTGRLGPRASTLAQQIFIRESLATISFRRAPP
jgi:transposase